MYKKRDMKDCVKVAIKDIDDFFDQNDYDYDIIMENPTLEFIANIQDDLKYGMQQQTAQEKLMEEFERLFHEAVTSRKLDDVITRKIDNIFDNGMCIISKDKMYRFLDEESECGYKAGRSMYKVSIASTVDKYYRKALKSKNTEAIGLFEKLKRELLL